MYASGPSDDTSRERQTEAESDWQRCASTCRGAPRVHAQLVIEMVVFAPERVQAIGVAGSGRQRRLDLAHSRLGRALSGSGGGVMLVRVEAERLADRRQ